MDIVSALSNATLFDAGLAAASFAAGYGFATKTALKVANERIQELKDELAKATQRITALEDQRFDLARGKE